MIERGWKYYPALRLLVLYVCGVVCATSVPLRLNLILELFGVVVPMIAVRRVRTVAAPVVVWLSSYALSSLLLVDERPVLPIDQIRCEIFGRARESAVRGDPQWRCIIAVDSLRTRGVTIRLTGRCQMRSFDAAGISLTPGERISAVGLLSTAGSTMLNTTRNRFHLTLDRGDDVRRIADAGLFQKWLERVREYIRRAIARNLVGSNGGIARALILGERAELTDQISQDFQTTGTIHVLAVSGLHIGVIVIGMSLVTSRIRRRSIAFCIQLALLFSFALLTGGAPPIARAVVMAGVAGLARICGRRARSINTLSFAGVAIVAVDPCALLEVSFLLSFSAVAGILAIGNPLADRLLDRRERIPFVRVCSMSIGAQVGTFPIVVATFGVVPLAALPANLLIVPAVSWSMSAVIVGVVSDALLPSLASIAFAAAKGGLDLSISVTHWMASTFAVLQVEWTVHPMVAGLVGMCGLVGIVARRPGARAATVVATVGLLLVGRHLHLSEQSDVAVIPIGRGIAVLVRKGSSSTIIYDSRIVSAGRLGALGRRVNPAIDSLVAIDMRCVAPGDTLIAGTVVIRSGADRPATMNAGNSAYLVLSLRWRCRFPIRFSRTYRLTSSNSIARWRDPNEDAEHAGHVPRSPDSVSVMWKCR